MANIIGVRLNGRQDVICTVRADLVPTGRALWLKDVIGVPGINDRAREAMMSAGYVDVVVARQGEVVLSLLNADDEAFSVRTSVAALVTDLEGDIADAGGRGFDGAYRAVNGGMRAVAHVVVSGDTVTVSYVYVPTAQERRNERRNASIDALKARVAAARAEREAREARERAERERVQAKLDRAKELRTANRASARAFRRAARAKVAARAAAAAVPYQGGEAVRVIICDYPADVSWVGREGHVVRIHANGLLYVRHDDYETPLPYGRAEIERISA